MKMIYDEDGKVYAIGTSKQCNKVYEKVILAYPKRKFFMADAEDKKRKDCIGAKQSVSFTPIQV